MNRFTRQFLSGRLGAALFAVLLIAGPPGPWSSAFGQENDMAFTVKIKPWGANSFDLTVQNDTREPIIGLTVQMDGTDSKFAYIYSGSLTRGARVLEPLYVPGGTGLVREVWNGIGGEPLVYLTANPRYPNSPDSRNLVTGSFEAPVNINENYGQRMHGYLRAPATGSYRFWIASDDEGELWLSSSTNHSGATRIARVPGWTSSRVWDKYAEQQSSLVSLQEGELYYMYALMKEGGGGDNLAIGWARPYGSGMITNRPMPANVFRIGVGGGQLAISDPSSGSDESDTIRLLDISGFERGASLKLQAAFTLASANAAKLLWNNGTTRQNAIIRVFGANGGVGELTLTDTASNESGIEYVFMTENRPRTLTLSSLVPDTSTYVSNYTVEVRNSKGALIESRIQPLSTNQVIPFLSDGMRVSIAVTGEVYQNAGGEFLYDGASIPPGASTETVNPARQRMVPTGLSVNNVPQTGDPTQYSFDLSGDTAVSIRWRHDFALLITHDFTSTESPERDPLDNPWAGPLQSGASGNPTPDTTKIHWIPSGEQVIAQIDGQVQDFSRPGLDIRYVPYAYRAEGSARDVHRQFDTHTNYFLVGQAPAQRQQVDSFVMDGWASIEYMWQIQFGVRVNVDDSARSALPRVFELSAAGGSRVEIGSLEGTFWFNPNTPVEVASAANETLDPSSLALSGWISGDGFYFSASGDINTDTGALLTGGPTVEGGSPVALWEPSFIDANGRKYRGLSIPNLRRPARVLWTYGEQAYQDTAHIGEYVFQSAAGQALLATHPALATMVRSEPTQVSVLSVAGNNQNVSPVDSIAWDPNAERLYPLVPGQLRVKWTGSDAKTVQVLVDVLPPEQPHYRHVAGTPPVQLTSDPDGTFLFKELKYTENDAAITDGSLFTADRAGRSVLVFREIKRIGRGDPKDYLRVRMVDTRLWNDGNPTQAVAVIGQPIRDAGLDLARLDTGCIKFEQARYNAAVYDVDKLNGLTVGDVYDLALLRSTAGSKVVVNRSALPGPIIPVNLHPGADAEERIVVVWYDDPAMTDNILWPYVARTYLPRWPTNETEGLGRIVIASQYGSESLNAQHQDQEVAASVTNVVPDGLGGLLTNVIVRTTTYDPSRIQQPAIYAQDNPDEPGYNPNEEHALMAPSRRFASVSPRPPAAYALRNRDLNFFNAASATEANQPTDYTSHPFVLVQYYDTAVDEFRMHLYSIVKDDAAIPGYSFANQGMVALGAGQQQVAASPQTLVLQPHVVMEAGEPVIPFYPLGVVIGASPCPETFGVNIKSQSTYWEDHKGTSWAVSGGSNAWFTFSIYYPRLADFWWPPKESGRIVYDTNTKQKRAAFPGVGDSVAFMPGNIKQLRGVAVGSPVVEAVETNARPNKILYKSDWPAVAPVLKAGETLTFSGGEYRQDNPTMLVADDHGNLETVPTPGLPGVLAFAVGEVVFDALNPLGQPALLTNSWTVRMAQVLEARTEPLSIGSFPTELLPASGRTRVSGGKYVFSDLPASLQKRLRYDPLAQSVDPVSGLTVSGRLEISGLINDKDIGERTLTAPPPAVYVLEPNIMTAADRDALLGLVDDTETAWRTAVYALYEKTRNPAELCDSNGDPLTGKYLVGLQQKVERDPVTGEPLLTPIEAGSDVLVSLTDPQTPEAARQFGPGLALIPNAGFLNPLGVIPGATPTPYPDVSWITVAENNDPSMGGSPVTLHVIKVDRRERYRGAIKTVLSDNVFDENVVLRHTGDFGGNADDLVFEWWYRPDDGSLNVMPPYIVDRDSAGPWALFPDLSGAGGRGRNQVLLKGNPNAPETLLADSWWFVRYRHRNDMVDDTDWYRPQQNGDDQVNFEWAGAGNNDPFNDYDLNGYPDYRAQLAMGWVKRVLDAVNPYEARIRDFEGDSPATVSSMLQQLGPRFEGPVALNPDKNVIENVGLIELYETILKRARDLSIDLSSPVSTPAIANALQLASTRLSDFYTLLGNDAYTDAKDPTIGFGSSDVVDGGSEEYGTVSPAVFSFQDEVSSLLEEELSLLRGVDDYYARPVYNRLFWNFTKGEGEAAYAVNYNVSDINADGFIDEDDAMILYPQGHGDAWGHYLTALRRQYDLLRHPYFNWVSRSEFYNLMDIVLKVDFLDERKFAQVAAAKARAGAEIVSSTYREHYIEEREAQWQGYTDVNKDRAWGVQDWARRAAQGAYFDWVTANALLPSQHPNETLEGIQKVDRQANDDIKVVSANLNSIQQTFDDANRGLNPLRISSQAVSFDINPVMVDDLIFGRSYFEQMYDRAAAALANAETVWNNANKSQNRLRQIANTEAEFRNEVFQEDLSYRNQLIEIFGRPYDGTVGSGKMYDAGYEGPDLALYMYVNVREINSDTVPGPTLSFATFDTNGVLTGGDILTAYNGSGGRSITTLGSEMRSLLNPTFAPDANGTTPALVQDGWYSVNYTDLSNPKVPLDNFSQLMPVKASGYTFQAPVAWGSRPAVGELQTIIGEMVEKEADVAAAIGAWDALSGQIVRTMRLANAKLMTLEDIRLRNEIFNRVKYAVANTFKALSTLVDIYEDAKDIVDASYEAAGEAFPKNLPTGGLAVSPGDALAPVRGGLKLTEVGVQGGISGAQIVTRVLLLASEIGLDIAETELNLANESSERAQSQRELLKEIEDLLGDEPVLRIAVFKEIEGLRALSDRYRSVLSQGVRLIDERAAFNKRVAAMTQRRRYQDMTFRIQRNHALQNYNNMFEIAARYVYLAAKAYDYETNFDPSDPASPSALYSEIIKARTLGQMDDGVPQMGEGGLAESLAWLRINHDALKGQLGFSNPQYETGKLSLRTELFRILPSGSVQPEGDGQFPGGGQDSDTLWRQTLQNARVENLWAVPEYRYYCRPFASDIDANGNAAVEPGLVIRFGTTITAGQNVFGHPLSGGDHAYDPSVFATKVRSVGVWFSDYLSDDVLNDLAAAPRVYLVPVGADIMSIPNSLTPDRLRVWNVVDQQIPVPVPSVTANLDRSRFCPLLDSLNGRIGSPRRYSSFRAYHNAEADVDLDELILDSRLVGRSVWNTEWLLIVPGLTLNSDPDVGLDRFIDQVSDIKLIFQTYGFSGN